jgi:hypothetical protein
MVDETKASTSAPEASAAVVVVFGTRYLQARGATVTPQPAQPVVAPRLCALARLGREDIPSQATVLCGRHEAHQLC